MKKIKLTKGKYALVDNEDFNILNLYKWLARKSGNSFYARYKKKTPDGKQGEIHMHRMIMKVPDNMIIDHIDGNGLNNQKKNLRICTRSENQRNRRKQVNNTSGYKGVWWSKPAKKWCAQIGTRGVSNVKTNKVYLGIYEDKEDARKAYIEACKKYHGEFANYK